MSICSLSTYTCLSLCVYAIPECPWWCGVDDDVPVLHVSVHHPRTVGPVQGAAQLEQEEADLKVRQTLDTPHHIAQVRRKAGGALIGLPCHVCVSPCLVLCFLCLRVVVPSSPCSRCRAPGCASSTSACRNVAVAPNRVATLGPPLTACSMATSRLTLQSGRGLRTLRATRLLLVLHHASNT